MGWFICHGDQPFKGPYPTREAALPDLRQCNSLGKSWRMVFHLKRG